MLAAGRGIVCLCSNAPLSCMFGICFSVCSCWVGSVCGLTYIFIVLATFDFFFCKAGRLDLMIVLSPCIGIHIVFCDLGSTCSQSDLLSSLIVAF